MLFSHSVWKCLWVEDKVEDKLIYHWRLAEDPTTTTTITTRPFSMAESTAYKPNFGELSRNNEIKLCWSNNALVIRIEVGKEVGVARAHPLTAKWTISQSVGSIVVQIKSMTDWPLEQRKIPYFGDNPFWNGRGIKVNHKYYCST